MKLSVVFASFIALCAGSALPLVPGDNSHYVEGESRYIWMPDGDDIPHLVDLEAPVEEAYLRSFWANGENNSYWLYTKWNPKNHQLLVHGDVNSVKKSNYNSSRPLRVIVHGWLSNGNSKINPLITKAFLATCDCNVIVLDWRAASMRIYPISVIAVPSVGQYLGNFLTWLISTAGGNWNNVHLVGFSLGAHVVGNAGRTTGGLPARITSLDPAWPGFGGNPNALTSTDGQYVEAIHTNGRILGYGIFDPIGLTNFYPNGGRSQPGCLLSACSHSRAYYLFAASVHYDRFVAKQCADLDEAGRGNCSGAALNMGNDVISKRGNGLFGLTTGKSWPY